MKDVTLNNGTVMTDAEYVREHGNGDTLTTFVATRDDLRLLVKALAGEMLTAEFSLQLQFSDELLASKDYTAFRFDRVMGFLPEMDAEVQVALRAVREKLHKNVARVEEVLSNGTATPCHGAATIISEPNGTVTIRCMVCGVETHRF